MKKQLSGILQSKEVKRLLENFFSLSVLKLVNAILPFVTLPYLIKVLGFQQYGAIVLALSLITYFQAITDYGFNLSATREIAQHRHSNKQLSYIYSKTLVSKSVLLFFSLLCLFILILLVPQFKEDLLVYFLMCLILIGQTLFPDWFFRGVEQMRYITVLDFMVKTSFTLGTFLFIKTPHDYWIYPLLYGAGFIVVSGISHYFILKKYKINFVFVDFVNVLSGLKKNFPLFLNQFMPNFYNNTTSFLIGMLLGKNIAGIFGAIRQFVNILNVFNTIVSMVFFPYLVRRKEKFQLFSRLYLSGFFILTVFMVATHTWIFKWAGIMVNDSSWIFIILAVGVFFIAIYSVYSTNFLITRGYDKIVMNITVFVSVIGLIFAYPLINFFGMVGGALNIAISQILMGIAAYFYYLKFKKIGEIL